jgi:Bacteriophage Sf6, terminase small subunit-like
MTGRRSCYRTEIADRILHELSGGRTLSDICGDPGMPPESTVGQWATDDREGFAARYRRVRELSHPMTCRPTIYTAEIADRILGELIGGRTLVDVCKDEGMPAQSTVRQWATKDLNGFAARYRRAREIRPRIGRATLYTAEIADRILNELMEGRSLVDVCDDPGMPSSSTVRLWANENREGFGPRYRRAREIGYHAVADEILRIADDDRKDLIEHRRENGHIDITPNAANVSRSRLRCNMRLWMLSKMLPRIYGNKLDLNAGEGVRDTLAELLREIDGTTRGLPNQDLMVTLPDPLEDEDDED